MHEPSSQYDQWSLESDLNSLLPICAVHSPALEFQEHDDWTKVKTHRGGRGTARQGTHQTSSCQQQTPCAGSRFAVLSDGGIDAFPILSAAQEPSARKPRMIAPPRRVGQSVFKNAVKQFRKLKENEKKPLLVATVNAGASDSEFALKADEIRHECWEERVRAKGETHHGRHQTLYKDRPTNAMPLRPQHGDAAKWQVLSLAVESRAAESVLSHMLIQDRPIRETWASKNGLNYISATGDPIPNLGEQRFPLITREGSTRSMTLQAAPVDRPLGSVKRMCQAGHKVVFDSDGSYVLNKTTMGVNWLREESGNFMLDMWVMPGSWVTDSVSDTTEGFSRDR